MTHRITKTQSDLYLSNGPVAHGSVRRVGENKRNDDKAQGHGDEHEVGVPFGVHLPVELVVAGAPPVVAHFFLHPAGDLLLRWRGITAENHQKLNSFKGNATVLVPIE